MEAFPGWKHSYAPADGSSRERESGRKGGDGRGQGQSSNKPDWPFGHPPKTRSTQTEPIISDSRPHDRRNVSIRKKHDWESLYLDTPQPTNGTSSSRRLSTIRGTTSMPGFRQHGDDIVEKSQGSWPHSHPPQSEPAEHSIPGAYPRGTQTAHNDGQLTKSTWANPLSPPKSTQQPRHNYLPDFPESTSLHSVLDHKDEHPPKINHHSTSDYTYTPKNHHSLKSPSIESFTIPSTHTFRKNNATQPSPTTNGKIGGSIPLNLALLDIHTTLTTVHTLFTTYETTFESRIGPILSLAKDQPLNLMWRDMIIDQFSRAPDRRAFAAARESIRTRAEALWAALDEHVTQSGYEVERRLRAARKVLAHMNEIAPLLHRAREERMGCKFLVEEVGELMGMLDPESHGGLYEDGGERRWDGTGRGVETKIMGRKGGGVEKKNGASHSRKEGWRKGKKEKKQDDASGGNSDDQWTDQNADAGFQQGHSSNDHQSGWKDNQQGDSYNNGEEAEQSGRENKEEETGSQKASSNHGDESRYNTPDCSGHSHRSSNKGSRKGDGDDSTPADGQDKKDDKAAAW